MDSYIDTRIGTPDADEYFFGEDNNTNYCCNNQPLEAMLRYLAIKCNNTGDLSKTEFITSGFFSTSADRLNEDELNSHKTSGKPYEMLFFLAPTKKELPIVTAKGWISLEKPPYPVASFITAKTGEKTSIWIKPDEKRAVIITEHPSFTGYSLEWCRWFAACLIRILPWRFHGDTGNEEEQALATAFAEDDQATIIKILDSCCEIDFRLEKLHKQLDTWGASIAEYKIENLKKELAEVTRLIQRDEEQWENDVAKGKRLSDELYMYQLMNIEPDTRLSEFFKMHKQITLLTIKDSFAKGKELYYSVTDTIEYYDEDEFLKAYNNPKSYLGTATAEMRKVLYNIFIEHKGLIRTESLFRLKNFESLGAAALENFPVSGRFDKTCLPHPHHTHYQCLGSHRPMIEKYLLEGNWDLAIEQTIAANKNVNFGDTTVMPRFITDIKNRWRSDCRMIIADNGKEMTPKEFYEYVTKGETENA